MSHEFVLEECADGLAISGLELGVLISVPTNMEHLIISMSTEGCFYPYSLRFIERGVTSVFYCDDWSPAEEIPF